MSSFKHKWKIFGLVLILTLLEHNESHFDPAIYSTDRIIRGQRGTIKWGMVKKNYVPQNVRIAFDDLTKHTCLRFQQVPRNYYGTYLEIDYDSPMSGYAMGVYYPHLHKLVTGTNMYPQRKLQNMTSECCQPHFAIAS